MKFIIVVLLTALLGYAAPLYFAWWSFAVTSFIITLLIHQKAFAAFAAAFLGLFLLWAIMAMLIDNANNHLLSQKIAMLLHLGSSSMLLILITRTDWRFGFRLCRIDGKPCSKKANNYI